MKHITESLRATDLRHFVKKVFEIDSYKSKIGDDEDIVVVAFTVDGEDPARDLENFIEMGYDFVLDADITPGEMDDGKYRVFVELERSRHVASQINAVLDGVKRLCDEPNMRFRYFKSFKSQEASLENLELAIPTDAESYNIATEENMLENFSNFFRNSYAEEINLLDESISFKKSYGDLVKFNIITSGTRQQVYDAVQGPIMLESSSMAEVMFLSKYIGPYNITKIGDTFIFENSGWAVALKRKL
jgi:hypothetical protein